MEEKTLQNRANDGSNYQHGTQGHPLRGQYEPYPEDLMLDSQARNSSNPSFSHTNQEPRSNYHANFFDEDQFQNSSSHQYDQHFQSNRTPEYAGSHNYDSQSLNTIDYQNVVQNQRLANPQYPNYQNPVSQNQDKPHTQGDYYNAPNNINNPHSTISQNPTQPQTKPQDKSFLQKLHSQTHMNNEKFIVIALLAAVILTSVIIGLGWSLLSPQKAKISTGLDKGAQSEDESSAIASTIIDETDTVSEPDTQENVTIVYGSQDLQATPSPEPTASPLPKPVQKLSTVKSDTQPQRTQVTTSNTRKVVESPTTATRTLKPVPSPSTAGSSTSTSISATSSTQNTTQNTQNKSPVASHSPTITPPPSKSSTPVVSSQRYWIQIFSTTNKDKILQIKQEFVNKGLNPIVVTKLIRNKLYYRLRLGPYTNKLEGKKFLEWIKNNPDYNDAYIVLSS